MCVDYRSSFPSSSKFTLSSTPPTLHFDHSSINDGSISEQETIIESPSDVFFHGLPPNRLVNVQHYESYYPVSAKKAGKRPASRTLLTPPLSPTQVPSRKKSKMDMNMAKAGSTAALSAFQTPLATYVAQMVVWLWYGDFSSQNQLPPSSPLAHSPITHDPFEVNHPTSSRISALMVHPSPEFSKFVSRMLTVTSVSHSVAIVALLYVYRLKMRNKFFSNPGSEQRPFIAGLMLGNKYLDDNTYTNSTWAELAGMTLPEINKMETEFLVGLNYQLAVPVEEFTRWKNFLDGFMTSRAPSNVIEKHIRQLSSGKAPYPASTLATPSINPPIPSMHRARSASPPRALPPPHTAEYPFPAGYEHVRKRSAVDASMHDPSSSAAIYESLRMPTRKAGFTQPLQSTQHLQPNLSAVRARPPLNQQNSGSTARSSSLSRQHGRMIAENQAYGRRGSVGHTLPAPLGHVSQHVSPIAVDGPMFSAGPAQWEGGRALLAPCEYQPQAQFVPPEHLMFYSLTAEPHPGVDGAPRKAILRYQEPNNYVYPSQPSYAPYSGPMTSTTPSYPHDDVTMYEPNNSPSTAYPSSAYQYPVTGAAPSAHPQSQGYYTYPAPMGWSPTHVLPEPAQFANAGPPGINYHPSGQTWKAPQSAVPNHPMVGLGLNTNTSSSMNVDGQMIYTPNGVVYTTPVDGGMNNYGQWGSRSEWSSPLIPRYD